MSRALAMLAAAVASLALAGASAAAGSTIRSTKHGDRTVGPQRFASLARGECGQCHDSHRRNDSSMSGANPFRLFGPNDNELCFTCHNGVGALGIYPGTMLWRQSEHANSTSMTWPGPRPAARSFADSGKCINCHAPHGSTDPHGVLPSLLNVREEVLCEGCHDGSRGPDIRAQFAKPYRHPINLAMRHDASEGDDRNGVERAVNEDRHSECVDCHNPHQARRDVVPPSAPDLPASLSGVSRVQVSNGGGGMLPSYSYRTAADVSPAREYELCFKCHSSWARQPHGQENLALLTNPENPSYHPIQDVGKNSGIDPAAFVSPRSARDLIYCTDCHSSDDRGARGPHGSQYRYILKKEYIASSQQQVMPPTSLCFDCHAFAVYADPSSAEATSRASRFNSPASAGHIFHVGAQRIPCYACHESHGSVRYPALIASSRNPGVRSYMQNASGGTCTPTCHLTRTYTVNYPR